jgi:YD repeat-containing protein
MKVMNSKESVRCRRGFATCNGQAWRVVLVILTAFLVLTPPLAAVELPDIKDGFTPPGLEPGSPAGSYVLSGFDTVSYFNGSLNFALPLLQVGGRGSAGYPVTLRIGADWDVDSEVFPPNLEVHYSFMYEGWSSRSNTLHPGMVNIRQVTDVSTCVQDNSTWPNHYESVTRLTFRSPGGTEIELRDAVTNGEKSVITTGCGETLQNGFNRGTVFRSSDGSALTFVASQDILDLVPAGITEAATFSSEGTVNTGVLYFPNGTRYEISGGDITKIADKNGNYVTIQYDASSRILAITDSMGRTIDFIHGPGPTYTKEIQFEGIGGVTRSIFIRRKNLADVLFSGSISTIASLFSVTTGQGTFDPVVTSEVELPNGKKYEFKYTEYGDLAQVILPTGGKIEYVWAAFPGQGTGGFASATGAQVIRAVMERKTYSSSTTLVGKQLMTYSFLSAGSCPVGGSSSLEATKAEVEHQDGVGTPLSKEVHYYCDKPGSEPPGSEVAPLKWSAWKSGKEYKTEYFDANGTTLLRTIDQAYEQRNPAAQPIQVNEPSLHLSHTITIRGKAG